MNNSLFLAVLRLFAEVQVLLLLAYTLAPSARHSSTNSQPALLNAHGQEG